MKNLKALPSTISPRAGGYSISKAASVPFARDISTRNRNYYCWAPPPCVYPLSTWHNYAMAGDKAIPTL